MFILILKKNVSNTLDGDYLSIDNKSKNGHVITLCYVDNSVIEALENLFINEKSDRSKIIWPRRAGEK